MPPDRPEDEQLKIRPGVAGMVYNSAGDILLHRRAGSNGWAPPSGTVEPREDLLSALKRELQEETALDVKIERLVGIYSDPTYQIVRYPDGSSVHFVTTLFECSVRSGRLEGSDEGSAWGWFGTEALPSPLLPYAREWLQDTLAEHSNPLVR
jgi:ADP-ribose pyrophosphatase YjhB (NUDIX family)